MNIKDIATKVKNGVALKFQIKFSGANKIELYVRTTAKIPQIKKP